MANKRITQLNEFTGNPSSNDVFVFVQNSSLSTYKITYSNLLSSNNTNVNSVYTTVRNNSAFWDEENALVAPLQTASGYWNNAYNNLVSNSADWDNAYTNVSTNSSIWNYTYTNVSTNSSTYATIGFTDGKFLPVSGGNLTGNVTSTGTISTNNDATFASLSSFRLNVDNYSFSSGASSGVYLNITVAGSAFKIPLNLVS